MTAAGGRQATLAPVAVDAMGGDRAPGEIVAGARQAAKELPRPVVLVGRPEAIEAVDGGAGGLEVIPAGEVIAMDEDPAQGVRRKKDSSLVRAAEAVRDGRAAAMVSAGNTGATMAPIPVPGSTPTVLLDAGANAECAPAWMVQFAQMGSAFARERFGIAEPRVGLLSIGEEPAKGTTLVKEVHELLAAAPGVRFVGNVEGRAILSDAVDVVVTDGFTGNVALKTLEGSLRFLVNAILEAFTASEEAKAAAQVLLPALAPLADQLDPDSHGGAMLLGVDGVCIISHGSSSARAIVNAVRVAHEMVERGLVDALRDAVAQPVASR